MAVLWKKGKCHTFRTRKETPLCGGCLKLAHAVDMNKSPTMPSKQENKTDEKRQRPKSFLDLFSTSPTTEDFCSAFPPEKCNYRAPYFAYQAEGKIWNVTQGNCHHWDCPRCGLGRAKAEYGRIVQGCRTLALQSRIFFITITCKGRGLGVKDAEKNYLKWTNRFLDACRQKCKRSHQEWYYVQVTERQKRKHPHSHILTSFDPQDTYTGYVEKWETPRDGRRRKVEVSALRSNWIQTQVCRSGLGEQYDISIVETVEGASRYVAKYLFKDSIFTTDWPPRWKRVRYSQSFPKLEERKTNAFVLLQHTDWYRLAKTAFVINCVGFDAFAEARNQMYFHDVIIRYKREGNNNKT